jgi:hypothetical protein
MRDVAMMVVGDPEVAENGDVTLDVMWWNTGNCHEPWLIAGSSQEVVVKKDDVKDWSLTPDLKWRDPHPTMSTPYGNI